MFGNILLSQTMLMLRKAGPRMLSVILWKCCSGWRTSRAAAHILRRPVLGQLKAGILKKLKAGIWEHCAFLCLVKTLPVQLRLCRFRTSFPTNFVTQSLEVCQRPCSCSVIICVKLWMRQYPAPWNRLLDIGGNNAHVRAEWNQIQVNLSCSAKSCLTWSSRD